MTINLSPHPDGCTFRVETIGGKPFRATCETHNAPAVRDVADTHWICGYAQNDEFADAYRLECRSLAAALKKGKAK